MKIKGTVCVDLDGVVFDFHQAYADYYFKKTGAHLHLSNWNNFPYPTGMNPGQFDKLHWDFIFDGGYKDIPVVEGVPETLNSLALAGYLIVFLTARPREVAQQTGEALQRLAGKWENRLIVDADGKTTILRHGGKLFDLVVDDTWAYAADAFNGGCPHIALVDKPWNKQRKLLDTDTQKFKRVSGLKGAVSWFLEVRPVLERV